jgi:hypothetical protein
MENHFPSTNSFKGYLLRKKELPKDVLDAEVTRLKSLTGELCSELMVSIDNETDAISFIQRELCSLVVRKTAWFFCNRERLPHYDWQNIHHAEVFFDWSSKSDHQNIVEVRITLLNTEIFTFYLNESGEIIHLETRFYQRENRLLLIEISEQYKYSFNPSDGEVPVFDESYKPVLRELMFLQTLQCYRSLKNYFNQLQ